MDAGGGAGDARPTPRLGIVRRTLAAAAGLAVLYGTVRRYTDPRGLERLVRATGEQWERAAALGVAVALERERAWLEELERNYDAMRLERLELERAVVLSDQ